MISVAVGLIATVVMVVTIIQTQAKSEDRAVGNGMKMATAEMLSYAPVQDIGTATAEIVVGSSDAGMSVPCENVVEVHALAVNHVYLWDIDTVIAGKMLGSGTFNG